MFYKARDDALSRVQDSDRYGHYLCTVVVCTECCGAGPFSVRALATAPAPNVKVAL